MQKISTAEEIIQRFKKVEETVEYGDSIFKIRKLKAGSILFSNGVLALPFMNGVVEKWNVLSEAERAAKAEEVMGAKEGQEAVSTAILLHGVIEPPFTVDTPAPSGFIPVQDVEEELKVFLVGKILKLSSLDAKSAEFFRAGASGVLEGAGPSSEPLQSTPQ